MDLIFGRTIPYVIWRWLFAQINEKISEIRMVMVKKPELAVIPWKYF